MDVAAAKPATSYWMSCEAQKERSLTEVSLEGPDEGA